MCLDLKLNILIVSDNQNFNNNIDKLTTSYNHGVNSYEFKNSIKDALELLKTKSYELFIINIKRIDDESLKLLLEYENMTNGVILLVNGEDYKELFKKTFEKGILIIERPVTVNRFVQASKLAVLSSNKKKKLDFQNIKKLNEIRKVDVAKLLLIINEKMSEEESHRFLEKYAMDLRVTKEKSAEHIIEKYIKF